MRFRALAAVVALGLASPAAASFTSADAGTSGAQFMLLGAGARAAGMSEAYTAVADGGDALYWNPAALSRVEGTALTLAHTALPAGINYEYVGAARRLGRFAGIGASIQYLSQPSIDQTDAGGIPTGATFRPSDLGVTVGGAYILRSENLGIFDGASVGLSGKYLRSTLTKSASAYAADIGIVGAAFPVFGQDFRFAYAAQNLGGGIKFQQTADALPEVLRFGGVYNLLPAWLLSFDIDEPLNNHPYAAVGTEGRIALAEGWTASLRGGVNTRSIGDAGGFSGVSLGVGLDTGHLGVDYAFSPLGALGTEHRVSLSLSF